MRHTVASTDHPTPHPSTLRVSARDPACHRDRLGVRAERNCVHPIQCPLQPTDGPFAEIAMIPHPGRDLRVGHLQHGRCAAVEQAAPLPADPPEDAVGVKRERVMFSRRRCRPRTSSALFAGRIAREVRSNVDLVDDSACALPTPEPPAAGGTAPVSPYSTL